MKKGLTEIVFILDRSGSMGGLEKDTIGGFNSMMEKQKKEDGEAFVSTILFDDRVEVLHDRIAINNVPKMTDKQYYVRGCTALLDAVGSAIDHISSLHKKTADDEKPEKTLFVITTDGMENASHKYSYEKIQKMIKKKQDKKNWEFIFIGANIDSIAEASRFGIKKENAVDYVCDSKGTETLYEAVGNAVCAMRMAPTACACLSETGWSEGIKKDYKARGFGKPKF